MPAKKFCRTSLKANPIATEVMPKPVTKSPGSKCRENYNCRDEQTEDGHDEGGDATQEVRQGEIYARALTGGVNDPFDDARRRSIRRQAAELGGLRCRHDHWSGSQSTGEGSSPAQLSSIAR